MKVSGQKFRKIIVMQKNYFVDFFFKFNGLPKTVVPNKVNILWLIYLNFF